MAVNPNPAKVDAFAADVPAPNVTVDQVHAAVVLLVV